MYPIGFVTMADYLTRNGHEVRIANLAVRMLSSSRFDPEAFIKRQRPGMFGVGLHWLPHAHGAIEAAKVCKEHHPEIPVILGGFSSTYFHTEIMERYPFVDYVMRGDSTERPMARLLDTIDRSGDLSQVPNLTWRDGGGKVRVNKKMDVADDMDHLSFDYDIVVRSIVKYKDIAGYMPTPDWRRYPVSAMMTVRGCTLNCITCGGSSSAYETVLSRKRPAYRAPEKLVADMAHLSTIMDGPIFLVCDIRQPGKTYAEKLLKGLRRERIQNEIVVELFWPANEAFVSKVSRSIENFNMSLSPDSHDPLVREALGRHYDNKAMERCISASFKHGCNRFDLYFMIGLPRQDTESPVRSVEYCSKLMADNPRKELHCYISPQAPFLDPGSLAFEDPERYGYILKATTLEAHRQLLTQPSWKHTLNFETRWLTADDILRTTYQSAADMNDAKLEHGLVEQEEHHTIAAAIEASVRAMAEIDTIIKVKDPGERGSRLHALKGTLDRASRDILAGEHEMEWQTKGIKYGGVLRSFFKKRK